ncbi:MAG: hypothetical protein A3H27_07595 [Acidobacteria bacterium RIFCSPLOWO2_02_FULL_59_13]|nr:MAG: hypothetical protein A3H27_07595 [Acidobacteria bacterium RIFCSPLOWO2_02_FULL_59_13]
MAEWLRQLAHTGDGVFAVDRDHRIIFWKPAVPGLLGYSDEEVLGKYCHDVIQGCDCGGRSTCGEHCPHFEQARRGRWVASHDLQTHTKDGHSVWVNMTTVAVLTRQKKLSALVHIFREAPQRSRETSSPQDTCAAQRTEDVPAGNPLARLTRQEWTVLGLLAEGLGTPAIAKRLFISPKTVRNHIENLLHKLEAHSRLEAVLIATRHHWI